MVVNFLDDEQPESSKVMAQKEIKRVFIDVLGIARTNLIKIQTPKIKFKKLKSTKNQITNSKKVSVVSSSDFSEQRGEKLYREQSQVL